MTARTGMAVLISLLRPMLADTGTVYLSDDRLQSILDQNRLDFYSDDLVYTGQLVSGGSTQYRIYTSTYMNVEGTASGTVAFRLYDAYGTVITSGYTLDQVQGVVTFTADQVGSARYLDGRTYDLYGAASDGWMDLAGLAADDFDFSVEDRSFSASQWYEHCMRMSERYNKQRNANISSGGTGWAAFENSDWIP